MPSYSAPEILKRQVLDDQVLGSAWTTETLGRQLHISVFCGLRQRSPQHRKRFLPTWMDEGTWLGEKQFSWDHKGCCSSEPFFLKCFVKADRSLCVSSLLCSFLFSLVFGPRGQACRSGLVRPIKLVRDGGLFALSYFFIL